MIYDNIKKIAKAKGYTVREVERALFLVTATCASGKTMHRLINYCEWLTF